MSRIPRNVIREIPPPVTNQIPVPVIEPLPPPVVDGLQRPTVDIPGLTIDYPTIDVPTEQDFQGSIPIQPIAPVDPAQPPDRNLPTAPTLPGTDIPMPPPEIVAGSAATAIVVTTASIVSAALVKKLLDFITEALKKKKVKVKIKKVKPVLHYVMNDTGAVDIFEYSAKGIKKIGTTEQVETYLRDQIEDDAFYETVNKVMIDESIKDKFTREGQKRFKSTFITPAKLAKKLASKLSLG